MATINYPSPWVLGFGQGIPQGIEAGLGAYYRGREFERRTAEDALRKQLLDLQIAEARNKLAAEQAFPTDITAALRATEPRTTPTLGGAPIRSEDLGDVIPTGLATMQQTAGVRTLPELANRMPAESLGRLLQRPNLNLVTALGLKSPEDVAKRERQATGRKLFADALGKATLTTAEDAKRTYRDLLGIATQYELGLEDDLVRAGINRILQTAEAKGQLHFGPNQEVLWTETKPGQVPTLTTLRPAIEKPEPIRIEQRGEGELVAVDPAEIRRRMAGQPITPASPTPPTGPIRLSPEFQQQFPGSPVRPEATSPVLQLTPPRAPKPIEAVNLEIATLRRDALREKSSALDMIEAIEKGKAFDEAKAARMVRSMGLLAEDERKRALVELDPAKQQEASDLSETYREIAGKLATALKTRMRKLPGRQGQAAERLSRKDPRYKAARDRGLTDEQIQRDFGLVLVD